MHEFTQGPWYAMSTGNHQGLVASEKTGENVAVTYRKEDALPISLVPEMVEIIQRVAMHFDGLDSCLGFDARAILSRLKEV